MIIESNPMAADSSAEQIFAYIAENSKNENVELLEGSIWDIQNALVDAQHFNRKHGIRHFQISSKETLSDEQFRDMIQRVKQEFSIKDDDIVFAAIHTFTRIDKDADKRHAHLGIRMVDAENGCVKRFDNIYQRQEKISRIAEIDYGFASVKGAHNKAVWHFAPDEYKEKIAKLCEGNLPHSAMSKGTVKKLTRLGKDTFQVKQDIKTIFQESETFNNFKSKIESRGWQITKGTKKPDMLIIVDENNILLGSVSRLIGIKKKELDLLISSPDSSMSNLIVKPIFCDTITEKNSSKQNITKSSSTLKSESQIQQPIKINARLHSSNPIVVNSEKMQVIDSMTHAQKMAIHDFNKRQSEKDEQLREILANQKKFNELLNSLIDNFEKGYSRLPREPWKNPDDRDDYKIAKKFHASLDILRNNYLAKKAKWFASNKAELDAFNEQLSRFKIKPIQGLDIIKNQKDYDYLLKIKASNVASFRERKHREWASSLDVRNYLKHKKEIEALFKYIKQNGDLELLLKSYKNPSYGYQLMLRKEQNTNTSIKEGSKALESTNAFSLQRKEKLDLTF